MLEGGDGKVDAVLPLESEDHATVLQMLLNDGELTSREPVMLRDAAILPFEIAVRISLAELAHLTALTEQARCVDPERWHRLAVDFETLYGLVAPGD